MSRRSLLVCGLLCLSALGLASEAGDWLKSAAKVPGQGSTTWLVIFTTGHFGSDPQLATATRDLAQQMLSDAGAPGDEVIVHSAEMSVWNESKRSPIEDFASLMPTTPQPGSKGGRDIEGVLEEVWQVAKGPILVLSPGASQEPKGGGKLHGGTVQVMGFDPIVRKEFSVETASGPRKVMATLLTHDGFFVGDNKRAPLPAAQAKRSSPPEQPKSVENPTSNATSPWVYAVLGFVAAVTITVIRDLAAKKPSPVAAASTDDSELQAWKAEAKSLQKKLDMIAQDLAAAAEQTAASGDDEKIELRQELSRKAKAISVWDETAMDFLDGIDRAMESASPEHQAGLQQAISQFSRFAQRAGLDPISPEIGEPVLDGFYRIDEVVPATKEFPSDTVVKLISRGFRRGDQVLRQARIVMAKD